MKKILLLRPDNIGDVILFSGALKHIRCLYPESHISIAVQKHVINLVELCPYINEVVAVEELSWELRLRRFGVRGVKRLAPLFHGIQRLFTTPYDLIVCPVKSPSASHLHLIMRLGAQKVIGIAGCSLNEIRERYGQSTSPKNIFYEYLDVSEAGQWVHEFYTILSFLKFIGCSVESIAEIQPEMWLSVDDVNKAEKFIGGGNVIGLFPGASSSIRTWGVSKFVEFIERMGNGYRYLLFGSTSDTAINKQLDHMVSSLGADYELHNLTGLTTLRELYAVISRCSLLVSMETAALHMGIAADIPTIGIVGGGHYGRFAPWGDPSKHFIATRMLDCFHCNWRCSRANVDCISQITPEEVASTAHNLLEVFPVK